MHYFYSDQTSNLISAGPSSLPLSIYDSGWTARRVSVHYNALLKVKLPNVEPTLSNRTWEVQQKCHLCLWGYDAWPEMHHYVFGYFMQYFKIHTKSMESGRSVNSEMLCNGEQPVEGDISLKFPSAKSLKRLRLNKWTQSMKFFLLEQNGYPPGLGSSDGRALDF